MSSERDGVAPGQGLKLYRELAEWYPLLTPVADYAEEAAFNLSCSRSTAGGRPGHSSTSGAAAATTPPTSRPRCPARCSTSPRPCST